MKNLLITPDEVIALAFSPNDSIDPQIVTDTRVETALLKFLEPVLGKLYQALNRGKYEDFCRNHIKPAAAYFVKYHIFLHLSVRIGNDGIIRIDPPGTAPVGTAQIARLRNESRDTAYTFLRKALGILKKNADRFPEFDPDPVRNKRPGLNGGILL